MNKHWVVGLAALVLLSACSRSTQLAVRAVASGDGEEVARAQQVIRLIPYDRDSLFEALSSQATESEPQPPADLLALRDSVSNAQQSWRQAESRWNEIRSELQTLSQQMDGMSRSSNQYFQAYQRFEDLDAQVGGLDRDKQAFFDQFTELQSAYNERADSFSAVLASWENTAFESYAQIVDSLSEALGEELVDTTDASGWANFTVPRRAWWVHTRAELVFEELYWNVAYRSAGGADTLVLNSANAQVRPLF